MPSDDTIRALMRASVQGLELEPSLVLADALQETDRRDLGEDLALVLAVSRDTPWGRRFFPVAERGLPIADLAEKERALRVLFRRLDRRFNWTNVDERERRRGLVELDEIDEFWRHSRPAERADDIESAIRWLDADDPNDSTLEERATWLFNGSYGESLKILADEIADEPGGHGRNREAMLFRLVLAVENRLPATATNRVWQELSGQGQANATRAMRAVLRSEGAEIIDRPPTRRRRRT